MKISVLSITKRLLVFLLDLIRCPLKELLRLLPVEFFGHKVRAWYYKNKFYSYGKKAQILEGVHIFFPELIQIGTNSSIGRYSELNPGPGEKPCLVIGDNTFIGPYCFFRTANHRFDNPHELFIKQGHDEKKIILGNDIYVGAHCIFLGGTEVGDHCVIAAGSVVSGKIPAYSIVAGNPARAIRSRLNEDKKA